MRPASPSLEETQKEKRMIDLVSLIVTLLLLFSIIIGIITIPCKASTYKNIICDGNLSDWSPDELLGVDGNCRFYLTWNATHFTAAWEGIDLANGDVYIAFDEDPTIQSGVSALYGGATFAGPNLPEFAIWVKAGLEPVVYQAHNGDNTAWGPVENVAWEKYGGWSDVKITELSIPRSYLGIAGDTSKPIGVWMWTTTEPGTGDISVTSTYPTTNPKGTNVQFTSCKIYHSSGDGISPGDSSKPAITNVNVLPTNTSAKITVETNEDCTLVLEYGTTNLYGQKITNTTFSQTHVFTIYALIEGTTYHFRINATDGSGNYNLSEDYTFTTLGGIKITVTSPTQGQTITTRRFTISANVSTNGQSGISSVVVTIDGLEHAMQLSGNDWIYEWSSYSNGAHTIKVKATDTNGKSSEISISVDVSLGINHGPSLLGTKVEPSSGDVLTNFEFMCDYMDEDGDKPVKMVVIIDNLEYDMNTTDTDFVNGAHYTYVTKLTKGEHGFKFLCDDGAGSQDSRYESSEYKLKVKSSSLQNTVDEKAEFCESISLCYIIPLLAFIGCAILIETMMHKIVDRFPGLKRLINKK